MALIKTKALRRSRKYETDDLQAQIRQAEKDFEEVILFSSLTIRLIQQQQQNLLECMSPPPSLQFL